MIIRATCTRKSQWLLQSWGTPYSLYILIGRELCLLRLLKTRWSWEGLVRSSDRCQNDIDFNCKIWNRLCLQSDMGTEKSWIQLIEFPLKFPQLNRVAKSMTRGYPYWKCFFFIKCTKIVAILVCIWVENYLKCYCLILVISKNKAAGTLMRNKERI